MSIEYITDGIIDLIKKNLIAESKITSDINAGDTVISVYNAYRFHADEEIVIIDYGYTVSGHVHYNLFEYAKIKSVNSTTSITLRDPVQSDWTLADQSFIQKTIGHSPLYADNVLYGDREVIPVDDIAITVEPVSLSNDWLYLQGGLNEEYRLRIMIYGKSIETDEGRRILDRYSWAVYSLLNSNIHLEVNGYDTPLMNDYSAGDNILIIEDTPENRENFVVKDNTDYSLQDNITGSCALGIRIVDVRYEGGLIFIEISPADGNDYHLSEFAVFRRLGMYIYDSRVDSINYGQVSKGSAFLRASEINWFGKKINEFKFPQTSDGLKNFDRVEDNSSSSSSIDD